MRFRTACGFVNMIGTSLLFLIALVYAPQYLISIRRYKGLQMLISSLTGILFIDKLWTVAKWINYAPLPLVQSNDNADEHILPVLTVVIPVYNESKFVQQSLFSILSADYPLEKIRVVVVDDGSTDDSWKWIQQATHLLEAHGVKCKNFQHKSNQGKRAAIITGFGAATGSIIVSLDSDSILDVTALRALIAPIVLNPKVGGVAGHLSTLNVQGMIIPRILDVLFDSGGNVPRAAQSHAGGFVTILPGALSAFRKEAVQPLLSALGTVGFLGAPLRHGEDIQLTLGLRQAGWITVYQSNAVVYTTAPVSPMIALRMYTRWERSSYVYMVLGFLRLSVELALWRPATSATISTCADEVGESRKRCNTRLRTSQLSKSVLEVRSKSFYPLLNIIATAISNPFVVVGSLYFMFVAICQPAAIYLLLVISGCSSAMQTFLFLAEALKRPEQRSLKFRSPCARFSNSTLTMEGAYGLIRSEDYQQILLAEHVVPQDRYSRLGWRPYIAFIAGPFQALFLSWSSILALANLTNQDWLTR